MARVTCIQAFGYTSALRRLVHAYPAIYTNKELHGTRLLKIVDAIERIDPNGTTDFDARKNLREAAKFGCADVILGDVREAPYGVDLTLEMELKTLCYLAHVKGGASFVAVVNVMAHSKVTKNGLRRALAEAGMGAVTDFERADIGSLFGIGKGEVHPLLMLPRDAANQETGEGLSVVHVYDLELAEYGYVTTNGGHPLWTTEFRRDEFVRRMREAFSRVGAPNTQFVCVANVTQVGRNRSGSTALSLRLAWHHDVVGLLGAERALGTNVCQPGFITGDTTTVFIDLLKAAVARRTGGDGQHAAREEMSIYVLRNAALDFHLVKFPQCWRTVFEQLGRVIAEAMRLRISPLFVDCNILPAQVLFEDQMLPDVREFVIRVLRAELRGELREVADEDLVCALQRQLKFLPKSSIVARHVRDMVNRGDMSDAYIIGGSQVSDPALSVLRTELDGISGLQVHALSAELVRNARRAMYFEEQSGANAGFAAQARKVEELYLILNALAPSIARATRPVVLLSSTSICQAYHTNGKTLIPHVFLSYLEGVTGVQLAELHRTVALLNSVRVLSTTELYAEGASDVLLQDNPPTKGA